MGLEQLIRQRSIALTNKERVTADITNKSKQLETLHKEVNRLVSSGEPYSKVVGQISSLENELKALQAINTDIEVKSLEPYIEPAKDEIKKSYSDSEQEYRESKERIKIARNNYNQAIREEARIRKEIQAKHHKKYMLAESALTATKRYRLSFDNDDICTIKGGKLVNEY